MRKKLMSATIVAVFAVAGLIPLAGSAGAVEVGNTEGCTPGFWKTHRDWPAITGEDIKTDTTLGSLGWVFPADLASYSNMTLLQALSLKGGSTYEGAVQILLRAAAASWLNAAVEIEFPYRRTTTGWEGLPSLISLINGALASGDRATVISLAATLDQANNLGCPL